MASSSELHHQLCEWAKPYPPPFAVLAMRTAAIAEPAQAATEWALRRFPHPQVPGPYLEARIWDYYADYRSLIYDLQGLLLPQISTPKERLYRRLDRLPELISRLIKRGFRRRSRERLHKDWKIVHRYGRLCVRAEARAISSPEDEVMEGFDIERFMRSAPGAYFFRVAFPCWLLNGQWPHELFRLASRVERPSLVESHRQRSI